MTDDHHRYAEWAAAYTLGALDAEDRRSFEAHLDTCNVCAAELAELAPLPGLIARVQPGDVDQEAGRAVGAGIAAKAGRELAALRRRARRWRLVAVGSAAAVMLLALGVVLPGGSSDSERPALAVPIVSSRAATAEVEVSTRGWGTEVTVRITGLPARQSYQLWTVDSVGDWISVATWSPTPSGAMQLVGASRTATDQLDRVLVTSEDRGDVLVEAAV